MRTLVLFFITILFSIFHTPGYAYYQWYDDRGIAHFTQDVPPVDAQNKDGSEWWNTKINQEEDKNLRKYRVERARQKIKNHNAPGTNPANNRRRLFEKYSAPKTRKKSPEDSGFKGFIKYLAGFFSKETKDEGCKVPWLVEKHGICPLGENEPDMAKIGNKFKAVVVDNRKCVWSDCRGTYNDDIITFIYKGQGYWETDGNVPECSFYKGFYWK
jgi:hypothetical protein